jgi:DMSO reductase anchor subunit
MDLKIVENNTPEWFPKNKLKPAFQFSNPPAAASPVLLIPPRISNVIPRYNQPYRSSEDWSLIIFTLGVMISVSLLISALMQGKFPSMIFPLLLSGSAIISFFHLGKPLRAWRAIKNVLKSPLSREILFFTLFATLSLLSILTDSPGILLASGVAGIMLLVTIDLVYIKADRRSLLHSGQVFLGSLMMVSWITGNSLPFLFIAVIRTGLSSWRLFNINQQQLRFLRIGIMILATAGLVTGYLERSITATMIILIGELIDRILFYIDFRPENIRLSLNTKHKV